MKKAVLALLTLGCIVEAQAQLVHNARDIIISVLSDAKEIVKAHPYISATVGCITVACCWKYFKKQSEDEDPYYEMFKNYWGSKPSTPKSVSPSDSPTHSTDTFKDFTGDFPYPQSKTFHPTKLRHN